jgi:hypothetical protein
MVSSFYSIELQAYPAFTSTPLENTWLHPSPLTHAPKFSTCHTNKRKTMRMEKKVAIMAVLADGEGGGAMPMIGIINVVVFYLLSSHGILGLTQMIIKLTTSKCI